MSYLPHLEQRNFWLWFVITICTFGIGGIVYMYLNLDDLNKLDKYPRPKGVPSTEVSLALVIVLCCCLPPIGAIIAQYYKFDKLHNYIKYHPQKQRTQVVSGGKFLLISIIGAIIISGASSVMGTAFSIIASTGTPGPWFLISRLFTAFTSLLSLGLSIYILILNYQWQEAFNERARMLLDQPAKPVADDLPVR
jgi:hypothetical protein